jgi:hypothetical protein
MGIEEAIAALADAGIVFSSPESSQHLSLGAVASRLDCSTKYLREHLHEFPGAWRMPGGELRIPARDVEELAEQRRLKRG